MKTRLNRLAAATMSTVAAAALLAACDRSDDAPTAGEKLDATVAKVEQTVDQAKADAMAAGKDAKQAMTEAASTVTAKAQDATITAAVNTELAKDKELSALSIDVDTVDGRVSLRGEAPSDTARSRATGLAASIDGVSSVDNQLTVVPKS